MKSWRIINVDEMLLILVSLLLLWLLLLLLMILLLRRHIIWLILLLYLLFLNTIILLLYGSASIISSSRCIPQIQPIERSPKPVTSLVCVAQILDCSCDLGRRKIAVSLDLTIGLQLTDHTWASFLLNLFVDWLTIIFYKFNEILVADIASYVFII